MARSSGNDPTMPVVWVRQRAGATAAVLLDELLLACGFAEAIAALRGPVVIKPDLDLYEAAPHAGTEAALVEHLIDRLHDWGFDDVAVADARNEDDAWAHNRDPLVVPELAGWRFRTPAGRPYEVFDGRGGERWRAAALRINFAKNRTHEDCRFALAVHNLAGLAAKRPQANGSQPAPPEGEKPSRKATAVHERRAPAEEALHVLREAPPHWNFIDAMSSAHGGAGHRAPRALATHTLIASRSAVLADWAGAARMGLDPYDSPVTAAALRAFGVPPHRIDGDLTPYPLWRNVHPLMLRSARQRNAGEAVGPLAAAWFQTVDRERFALRDFYSDRMNALVTPLLARVDDNPRAFWTVVLLNLLLARLAGLVRAQHTLFSKDRLRRREAPLLIDPQAFGAADYDGIEAALAPYRTLLAHLPPGRDGLRWRHVDGAIVFGNEHVFAVPFQRWVRRVDIARSIQYMNDYIGGATVAVRRDGRGRVRHQAERNLYLQQPNWMVLAGGELIDVEKIQCIRREPGRQSIHWRTVASPNGSAAVDDGCVEFSRTAEGHTRVQIFARQRFTLPLALQLVDIDLAPGLRDPIVEAAYARFFSGTLANLQAACEGRDFRIGHDAEADAPQRALPRFLATAAAALAELLRHRRGVGDLGDVVGWLFGSGAAMAAAPAGAQPLATDEQGFRHFAPQPAANDAAGRDDALVASVAALARDAPDLLQGLADAVHRDLDRLAGG